MLAKILQDNAIENPVFVFANTGLEHEETLKFIHQCEINFNIQVVWLEYTSIKPLFKIVNFETAAREGEPFKEMLENKGYRFLPNVVKRFCTGDLKIKVISRYVKTLQSKGQYNCFLGLRFDEPLRVAKKKEINSLGKERAFYKMPLHEMRITKQQRNQFWAAQKFDLGIPDRLGNCVGCFMKGEYNLISIFRENPKAANFFIEMERKTIKTARKRHRQFNKVWSYKTLLEVSKTQLQIPEFEYQGINCSCTD